MSDMDELGKLVKWMDDDLDGEVAERYQDQPLAQDWARVAKVGEEMGEAIDALIGVTGQNPRKGEYGSREDLLDELADVALTGLYAIQHFTKDPDATLDWLMKRARYHRSRRVTTDEIEAEEDPRLVTIVAEDMAEANRWVSGGVLSRDEGPPRLCSYSGRVSLPGHTCAPTATHEKAATPFTVEVIYEETELTVRRTRQRVGLVTVVDVHEGHYCHCLTHPEVPHGGRMPCCLDEGMDRDGWHWVVEGAPLMLVTEDAERLVAKGGVLSLLARPVRWGNSVEAPFDVDLYAPCEWCHSPAVFDPDHCEPVGTVMVVEMHYADDCPGPEEMCPYCDGDPVASLETCSEDHFCHPDAKAGTWHLAVFT